MIETKKPAKMYVVDINDAQTFDQLRDIIKGMLMALSGGSYLMRIPEEMLKKFPELTSLASLEEKNT